MHLRSVLLRDWACHESLVLELRPGLNVVAGPNGVGKSTLCEAILTALTWKSSSKDGKVRLLEPWGVAGSGPSVVLELVRDDGRYRLSKTYLHEAASRVERFEGGRYVPSHRGRLAEDEIARWLDLDGAAGRLLAELWSPQADPTRLFDASGRSGRLSPASLIAPGLADRVGPIDAGPFGAVKRRVAEQVARSFTPTERRVKVGTDLHRASSVLREAEEHWRILDDRKADLARKVTEYRDLESSFRDDRERRDLLIDAAQHRERNRVAYRGRLDALRDAEVQAQACHDVFDRLDRDHRRLRDADAERASLEAAIEADAPLLEASRCSCERISIQLRRAEHRLANAGSLLDTLDGLLDRLHRLDDAERNHLDKQDAFATLAAEADRLDRALDQANRAVDDARQALEHADAGRDLAHRAAIDAAFRSADTYARSCRERLRRAERARSRAEASLLDRKIERLGRLHRDRDALGPEVDPASIPSAVAVDELRRTAAELDARADALDAEAIRVRFLPEGPVPARFLSDEDVQMASDVPAGGPLETLGVGPIVLEIAGVGRVEIRHASEGPADRRRRLDLDRVAFADRLAGFDADSIEALDDRRRIADRRAAIDAQRSALLGESTWDELRSRRDRLAALLDDDPGPEGDDPTARDLPPEDQLRLDREAADRDRAIARERLDAAGGPPLDSSTVPDALGADRLVVEAKSALETSEASARAHRERSDHAHARLVEARARLDDALETLIEESGGDLEAGEHLRSQIAEVRQQLVVWDAVPPGDSVQVVKMTRKGIEEHISALRVERDAAASAFAERTRTAIANGARLEAARRQRDTLDAEVADPRPAPDREVRLEQARDDRDRAKARAGLLLEQLGDDPDRDDPDLDDRLESLRDHCRDTEKTLAVRLRELEMLGADGLDTQIARALERLDAARDRHEALDRDARAWLLLDETIAEVEADHARNIARRIEGLAGRWIGRMTGRNVRSVGLHPDSLSPVAADPGLGLARSLELFSRGTREQVALACRLQLGVLLAQESRQMILLDDPLAHTDAGRHDEALDVLLEVAEALQVILFTCHPDRYARLWELGGAQRVDLSRPIIENLDVEADRLASAP